MLGSLRTAVAGRWGSREQTLVHPQISPDGLWRWDGRQWVATSESESVSTSPQYPGLPLQQAMGGVVGPAYAARSRQGRSILAVSALIASLLGLLMSFTTVLVATSYIFRDVVTGQRPWFEHYAYVALHFAVASIALVLAILGVRRHPGG